MKISEAALQKVKDWCGVTGDDSDELFETLMPAARAFICGYTGLTAEEADEHEDLTAAYLVIINDMFYNRTYTVDKSTLNPTAAQILNLHSVNLIA